MLTAAGVTQQPRRFAVAGMVGMVVVVIVAATAGAASGPTPLLLTIGILGEGSEVGLITEREWRVISQRDLKNVC